MNIPILIVSHNTKIWEKFSINRIFSYIPNANIILVDNNNFYYDLYHIKNKIHLIRNKYDLKSHGFGIDLGYIYLKKQGYSHFIHLDPDCIMNGRKWYDNFCKSTENQNIWVAGQYFVSAYHPTIDLTLAIHVAISIWKIDKIKYSFNSYIADFKLVDCSVANYANAYKENKTKLIDLPDIKHWGQGSGYIYNNNPGFLRNNNIYY